jgi:hypothetical protein
MNARRNGRDVRNAESQPYRGTHETFIDQSSDRLIASTIYNKENPDKEAVTAEMYQDNTEQYVQEQQITRTQQAKKLLQSRLQKKALKKVASKGALRYSISIAAFVYIAIQFPLAIISGVCFGLHGYILYVKNETLLGKFFGLFFNYENYLPFESVGYAALGIIIILTIAEFIIYFFLFKLVGINPLRSSISTVTTATAFALNLIPITNVFPWLLLWICYMLLFSKDE